MTSVDELQQYYAQCIESDEMYEVFGPLITNQLKEDQK